MCEAMHPCCELVICCQLGSVGCCSVLQLVFADGSGGCLVMCNTDACLRPLQGPVSGVDPGTIFAQKLCKQEC